MIPSSKDGTCPFKRNPKTNCCGYPARGPIVCNFIDQKGDGSIWANHCQRYWREASLQDIKPVSFCCPQMENLFHDSAEGSGYMAGGFDIRKYPNDGKDVWRNYVRTRFVYCPFCGSKLSEVTQPDNQIDEQTNGSNRQ